VLKGAIEEMNNIVLKKFKSPTKGMFDLVIVTYVLLAIDFKYFKCCQRHKIIAIC
jgi:hypothetical protein